MDPFSKKSLALHPSFKAKRKEPPKRPVQPLYKRPANNEDPFGSATEHMFAKRLQGNQTLQKDPAISHSASQPSTYPSASPSASPSARPTVKTDSTPIPARPLSAADRLVGQEHNVAKLRAWYREHNNRPAVLWGASGTGKTTVVRMLASNVVEFTPSSHDILAELKRSLQASSLFGDTLILLDDVDGMSPQLLENITKAFTAVGKRTTCALVATCTSLHTLPKCLTENSLVLHFARLSAPSMFALLRSVSPEATCLDRIVNMANGDARQALLTLEAETQFALLRTDRPEQDAKIETQGLDGKDDSGSPFQMVFAAMHKLPKQFVFEDFHATIFAEYIIPQPFHQTKTHSGSDRPNVFACKPKSARTDFADAQRLEELQNPSSLNYNPQSFEIAILKIKTPSTKSTTLRGSSASSLGSSFSSSFGSAATSSTTKEENPLAELQPDNTFKGRKLTMDWAEIGRKSAVRNSAFHARQNTPLEVFDNKALETPSNSLKFVAKPHEEMFFVAAPLLSDWRQLIDSAGLQQDIHTQEMRGVMSFVLEAAMRSATHKPSEVKSLSKAHAAVFHPRHWSPTDDLVKRLNNMRM